jgi:transcription elongation GreA/GreB family factor
MDNGNKVKYQILGEFESDPTKGSISFRSPLGKELIGSKKRDIVAIMRPAGDIEYEVLDIFVP